MITTSPKPRLSGSILGEAFLLSLFLYAILGFAYAISYITGEPLRNTAPISNQTMLFLVPLVGLWWASWQLPYLTRERTLHFAYLFGIFAYVCMTNHDAWWDAAGFWMFVISIAFGLKFTDQPREIKA